MTTQQEMRDAANIVLATIADDIIDICQFAHTMRSSYGYAAVKADCNDLAKVAHVEAKRMWALVERLPHG